MLVVIPAELGNRIVDHRLTDSRIPNEGCLADSGADEPDPLTNVGIETAGGSRLDGLLSPENLAGEVLGAVVDVDAHHLNHLFTLSTIHG